MAEYYGTAILVKWAAKIGIHTKTVIKALLDGYKIEQQGYVCSER